MRKAFFMVFCACVFALAARVVWGQSGSPRSFPVLITAAQFTLARQGTQQPIPLRRDALAVVGVGDTLSTTERGRAIVTVDDSDLLIMPNTTLSVVAVETTGDQVNVTLDLAGHIIIGGPANARAQFNVTSPGMDATVQGSAALWANFEGGSVITAERGTVRVSPTSSPPSTVLAPGSGAYIANQQLEVAALAGRAPFLHAAQAIGELQGCGGQIVRTGTDSLNLRVAPGLSSTIIGYIDAGAPTVIMGASASGNWQRVQRFSGFGWILSVYVESSCTALPAYPAGTIERNLELAEVHPDELRILAPFYGTPEQNLWVYRSFRASPYGESE